VLLHYSRFGYLVQSAVGDRKMIIEKMKDVRWACGDGSCTAVDVHGVFCVDCVG